MGSNRRIGVSVLVVALVLTTWKLTETAFDTSPADMGSEEPVEVVRVNSPSELVNQLREALMQGRSARIEVPAVDGDTVSTRDFWSRPLSPEEVLRAKSRLAVIRKCDQNSLWNATEGDELERAASVAAALRSEAMVNAADVLLSQGRAFVTRSLIAELESDDEFHYWNVTLRVGSAVMLVYVPIPLREFPEVARLRQNSRDVKAFAANERALQWNALDRPVRQDLVNAAEAARSEIRELEAQLADLRATKAGTPTRLRELGEAIARSQAALSRIPPKFDARTLDAPVR